MNIGIISKVDAEKISDILKKISLSYKKENSIIYNNFKNMKFITKSDEYIDILVLTKKIDELILKNWIKLTNKSSVIILNMDEKITCSDLKLTGQKIVTYGLNSKCTITTSSIIDSEYKTITFCIQREFSSFYNIPIEEQEFSINIKCNDVHIVLATITIALICGANTQDLKSVF